jgi:hypothetical protein
MQPDIQASRLDHDDDPESLAGDPMPDPWDDDEQDDWPTERVGDDA